VISADASQTDEQRALSAGASAFLPKPFTAGQLLRVIDGVKSAETAGDQT
jgi:CheY-like chemotaxis protein